MCVYMCVALGDGIRQNEATVDLLKDYVVQLRQNGRFELVLQEVPAADTLTTAYLFRGIT